MSFFLGGGGRGELKFEGNQFLGTGNIFSDEDTYLRFTLVAPPPCIKEIGITGMRQVGPLRERFLEICTKIYHADGKPDVSF